MFINEQYGLEFNEPFAEAYMETDKYFMDVVMYWSVDTCFMYCMF